MASKERVIIIFHAKTTNAVSWYNFLYGGLNFLCFCYVSPDLGPTVCKSYQQMTSPSLLTFRKEFFFQPELRI